MTTRSTIKLPNLYFRLTAVFRSLFQISRVCLMLLLLSGCATSVKNTTWKATETFPRQFKNIVVIGLIAEDTQSIKMAEQHLAADLEKAGYTAYAFLDKYNFTEFSTLPSAEAYNQLRKDSIDAILTLFLKSEKDKKNNKIENLPTFSGYEGLWDHYKTISGKAGSIGHDSKACSFHDYYAKEYDIGSNLYDLSTEKLIYTLETQSFKAVCRSTLWHEYGRIIVSEILKNNVVATKGNLTAKEYLKRVKAFYEE